MHKYGLLSTLRAELYKKTRNQLKGNYIELPYTARNQFN